MVLEISWEIKARQRELIRETHQARQADLAALKNMNPKSARGGNGLHGWWSLLEVIFR